MGRWARLSATSGYRPASRGKSGLGIEVQREAIARFAAAEGRQLLAEFVAVETGKGADALDDRRPKLAEARAKARKAKAPVVSAAYPAMWGSFPAQWTSGCRSS